MKLINRIIKRILFNFYLIQKTNWIALIKNYNSTSNNILFLCPSFPKKSIDYFFSGVFENDFALINALIENNLNFKIIFGHKKILNQKNKTIFFNISNLFTFYHGENYASSMLNFLEELEKNNRLIPNLKNAYYWENKIFMHEKFIEFNVSHPKTITVKKGLIPPNHNINFPLLIKPAHGSGSTGIELIKNQLDYIKSIQMHSKVDYLIQEWIDMKSDLRLIFIGDELVLHYWRKNNNLEWAPTSTGHGSSVDFETLPANWMPFIFNEFKKLNLVAGAFDITWQNDDLASVPLILEVSPSFMPNPAPTGKYLSMPYKDFKKSMLGKEAYHKQYINLVFELKSKLIKAYLKLNEN